MSSENIYTNFKPTFLYIKQHTVTGKLYFGKTTQNPETYLGSGTYWTKPTQTSCHRHYVRALAVRET